jgi:hypothetical protein
LQRSRSRRAAGFRRSPLSGFELADSDELFGDTLQRVVTWQNKSDVSALADRAIRVRIAMRDADIYSLRFQP